LLVSVLTIVLVGLGLEAQTRPRSDDVRVPTAAAAGEESKVSAVNDWTVGIAGGFFEGTFIRFAVELAKALDDGDNLRILPIVSYGGNENVNDLLYLKGGRYRHHLYRHFRTLQKDRPGEKYRAADQLHLRAAGG
jgi:hypothetical protein